MATGNAPKGYEAEYKRAVHEGVVDPQNTFYVDRLRAWRHRYNKVKMDRDKTYTWFVCSDERIFKP